MSERDKYLDDQLSMLGGTTASDGKGDNSTHSRDVILHHETNRLTKRRIDSSSLLPAMNLF